jgi:N-acetylmuramoyl-L-alanine amidase-like protein
VKDYRGVFGPIAVVLLFLIGTRYSPFEPHRLPADPSGSEGGTASWLDEDWNVLESTVRAAAAAGLDTLPMGELMAEVGRGLVGTAYVPRTLEVEGPERLVVNLRGLDCVTFVENVYALSALLKADVADRLEDRGGVEGEYERALRALRYRGNVIDGYPSRLHYFSDWIADNEQKRLLTDVTADLGGVAVREPVDFMSTHPEAYGQLADDETLQAIRDVEKALSARGRHFVPKDAIEGVAGAIRNGDIIAATSTVRGLDVAHTGLALWVDGELRLLHAPLVGEAVQISRVSLAERILRMEGQDGIMVARPSEPRTVVPAVGVN